MQISNVQLQLNEGDILGIINEFISMDMVILNNIKIDRNIIIEGCLLKPIKIDFSIEVEINGVNDNRISGRIIKTQVSKLRFIRKIQNLVIKLIVNKLKIKGITVKKNTFLIDIKKILINVPYVDFNIEELYIKSQKINIDLNCINVSIMGNIIKTEKQEKIEEENKDIVLHKISDKYTVTREMVKEKIEPSLKGLSEYILVIPDIITLIYRLLKDDRVSIKTKITISASMVYVIFPNNLIPNKIPFVGKIDDVAVVFFALNNIVNNVKWNVILENWQGNNELIEVLKKGLEYITNFTGAANVEKLYYVVNEFNNL